MSTMCEYINDLMHRFLQESHGTLRSAGRSGAGNTGTVNLIIFPTWEKWS